jgi:hypothetical protein
MFFKHHQGLLISDIVTFVLDFFPIYSIIDRGFLFF